MDLRRRIPLGSSWSLSGDLQSVLFVRNSSSGILLDEPLESERPTNSPLLLIHPPFTAEADTDLLPCYLYLDLHKLHGYIPTSVELVSESKTIEMYSGSDEDYCSTARGTLLPIVNDSQKLYSCTLNLSADTASDKISLKVLSLRGRKQVAVSKVLIDVTEDHSGSKGQTTSPSTSSLQPEQLLSSLASHNLPPFLKSLVLSLQSVSTKTSDSSSQELHSTDYPGGPSQNGEARAHPLPEDLMQMAKAFRHVRSTIAPPDVNGTQVKCDSDTKRQDLCDDNDAKTNQRDGVTQSRVTEAVLEERMYCLEKKLESYIDAKFVKLERQINTKFEELISRLQRTYQIDGVSEQDLAATSDTVLKASVLVTDDHQLD